MVTTAKSLGPMSWELRRCNPIPRTLRDYFERKRTLSKAQLDRHRRLLLFEGQLKTKLQVLE